MTSNLKSPAISLGYVPVDDDHQMFVALLHQMEHADNVAFTTLFQQLATHTEKHFERENQLMQSSGFPALSEHRGDHHRVLGEFTSANGAAVMANHAVSENCARG